MNLIKEKWTKKDISDFYKFEKTLKGDSINCSWEQRIVNTKLPCYARTSTKAREVANKISKGNFLSFLDLIQIKTHFDSLVSAFLICKIKDFKIFSKYLINFSSTIDNWASCDTLKFSKYDFNDLYKLSNKLIKSKKEFVKRVGINMYFDLIKEEKYIYEAFKIFDSLIDCKQYYVNMVCAWLLSFIYVKWPAQTIKYFKSNKTNAFIINKAISKCRDSFRIDNKHKEMLKQYKK